MAARTSANSRTSLRIAAASSREPHSAYALASASTWSRKRFVRSGSAMTKSSTLACSARRWPPAESGEESNVAAVQQAADDVVLLQHGGDHLLDRHAGLVAVARRVLDERLLQVREDADVVDDQAAGLVAEGAVDAGDGLHEAGALHRLVDVHGVHRRGVEAGQPHVADDDELQRIVGVLGAGLEVLADVLGVQVRLELGRVGGRAGHDDLDLAVRRVVGVPVGSQRDDLLVEPHGDAAATS